MKDMGKKHSFWNDLIRRLKHNFFFNANETIPSRLLSEDSTSIPDDFHDSANTIKFIWLGHSTFLLSINSKIILVDPVFSDTASPVTFLVKRYQPPVISLTDLPALDYVLISHDHYEHLDMETVRYPKNSDLTFIIPLGGRVAYA